MVFAYPPKSSEQDEKEENPPISVCLKLLDNVAFFKTPHVARWDAAGNRTNFTSRSKTMANWFKGEFERKME